MKRVIIVHQWGGSPESDFYPWLKSKLEKKGFNVLVPVMPNPVAPDIESWVKTLTETVGNLDENTILVGHSVGCQTILRYLARTQGKASGIILVAPWLVLSEIVMNDEDQMKIAKQWLTNLPDNTKIVARAEKMFALFSDNDPYVPIENSKLLKEYGFTSEIIENRFHFDAESGITEVPEVLEKISEI